MRIAFLSILFVIIVSAAGVSQLVAQDAPTTKRTVIKANELTFDYKRSTAVFVGDVRVKDPGIEMSADKMNVIFVGTNEVKSVTAAGNVKMWHDDIVATCKRAVYKSKEGEVRLIGDAVLKRDDDTLRGDEITFWLDKELMICTPGYLEVMSNSEAPKLR